MPGGMRHTVSTPGSLGDCLAHLFAGSSGRTRKQMLATGRVLVNSAVARSAAAAPTRGDVVVVGPKTAPRSWGFGAMGWSASQKDNLGHHSAPCRVVATPNVSATASRQLTR